MSKSGKSRGGTPSGQRRPSISERTKMLLWAATAGRCTFCNRRLLENDELGEPVTIGELAHNVGWSPNSPRGQGKQDRNQRNSFENLLLVCRNCHKPIDQGGSIQRYTVEELIKRKREHEDRIRSLTEIGADRAAYVVRMVGHVRGVPPELSRETVLAATAAAGLYPRPLPTAHWADIDLDLRSSAEPSSPAQFDACVLLIHDLVARILDGVRRDAIYRVAIFAIARIPLLISLGAQLDDKLPAVIFQRQRTDDENAWRWPEDPGAPVTFATRLVRQGTDSSRVSLLLCLSGDIQLKELPAGVIDGDYVYVLAPQPPAAPGPSLVARPETLSNFESTLRQFLALVEADHGKVDFIRLFSAVPVSAAVSAGRVLMPHVSPGWRIFDRDASGEFAYTLEVRR